MVHTASCGVTHGHRAPCLGGPLGEQCGLTNEYNEPYCRCVFHFINFLKKLILEREEGEEGEREGERGKRGLLFHVFWHLLVEPCTIPTGY